MALMSAPGCLVDMPVYHVSVWPEEARRHRGLTTPGRDCPACPASRDEHDGWGCVRTGCKLSIAIITRRPRWLS